MQTFILKLCKVYGIIIYEHAYNEYYWQTLTTNISKNHSSEGGSTSDTYINVYRTSTCIQEKLSHSGDQHAKMQIPLPRLTTAEDRRRLPSTIDVTNEH